jgi:hypothetical protein
MMTTMRRFLASTVSATLIVVGTAPIATALASAPHDDLSGSWVLNRELSQFPTEVGFDPVGASGGSGTSAGGSGGRSRGGRGSAAPNSFAVSESQDDFARTRLLLEEVRSPASSITIVQSDTTVRIADDQGHARLFHTNGKDEGQPLDTAPVITRTRWTGAELAVEYVVLSSQRIRYTYARPPGQSRLLLTIQFFQDGHLGDTVKRVYDLKP